MLTSCQWFYVILPLEHNLLSFSKAKFLEDTCTHVLFILKRLSGRCSTPQYLLSLPWPLSLELTKATTARPFTIFSKLGFCRILVWQIMAQCNMRLHTPQHGLFALFLQCQKRKDAYLLSTARHQPWKNTDAQFKRNCCHGAATDTCFRVVSSF